MIRALVLNARLNVRSARFQRRTNATSSSAAGSQSAQKAVRFDHVSVLVNSIEPVYLH